MADRLTWRAKKKEKKENSRNMAFSKYAKNH